ncbi:transposase, partial [Leptospira mayottensis]
MAVRYSSSFPHMIIKDEHLEPVSKLVVLLNRNYLLVKWTNIIQ